MAVPRNSNYTVYTALQSKGAAETVNSIAITGLLADANGNILWCTGATVPTDGSAGYSAGGLFSGTTILWVNAGTATVSAFVPLNHG